MVGLEPPSPGSHPTEPVTGGAADLSGTDPANLPGTDPANLPNAGAPPPGLRTPRPTPPLGVGPPSAEPPEGAWERLARVFTRPRTAFVGLEEARFDWILPTVLVALVMAAAPQFVSDLHVQRQTAVLDQLIDGGVLTEEEAHEARQRIATGDEERGFAKILPAALWSMGSIVVFFYLLPAALLLVGLRFVMEGRGHFRDLLGVVGYASLPAAVREIVRTPLQAARGSLEVHFSPAVITGTNNLGGYALGLLDVFSIWILVLLVVGIASVGGISRGRAAGLVIPLWIASVIFRVGIKASPIGSVF